jgi:hypothetical protein
MICERPTSCVTSLVFAVIADVSMSAHFVVLSVSAAAP